MFHSINGDSEPRRTHVIEARKIIEELMRTTMDYVRDFTGTDFGRIYHGETTIPAPHPRNDYDLNPIDGPFITRAEEHRFFMSKVEDMEGGNPLFTPAEKYWFRQMADRMALAHAAYLHHPLDTYEDPLVNALVELVNAFPNITGPECDGVIELRQ